MTWTRNSKPLRYGIITLAIFIAAYSMMRCLPLSGDDIRNSKVIIEQETYYEILADGRPILYFSQMASDSTFSGGVTSPDSLQPRKELVTGYWVNSLPLWPSCFGKIMTKGIKEPTRIMSYSSNEMHRMLLHQFISTDHVLAGIESQRNELRYYMRTHDVTDYGYGHIAAYSYEVKSKIDSLHRVMRAIYKISRNRKLTVKRTTRYHVVADSTNRITCSRIRKYEDGTILIQTLNKQTPSSVHTKMSFTDAKHALYSMKTAWLSSTKRQDGTIIDSTGTYHGETKDNAAHGFGYRTGNDGSYMEGHWTNGQLNGWGFSLAPHSYLMAGEWKKGVFKGERLRYNATRVYGIDISKHQHEIGRHIYPIHWDKLRITGLGKISSKEIEGKVNYPVSFIYIKSTEGTTVLNKYYQEDYRQARQHGLAVGTYHFFSTTSPASKQAEYFLKNSRFLKGDIPPVLDVEPSDAKIREMGGIEVLFQAVRTWLETVHRRTGKRPILYINQMFVNKYLDLAPDIKDNYLVWIARYGEWKPDIKLSYWQLSPDGSVQGIKGDVDINVFNGYKNEYDAFLKRHCFK